MVLGFATAANAAIITIKMSLIFTRPPKPDYLAHQSVFPGIF